MSEILRRQPVSDYLPDRRVARRFDDVGRKAPSGGDFVKHLAFHAALRYAAAETAFEKTSPLPGDETGYSAVAVFVPYMNRTAIGLGRQSRKALSVIAVRGEVELIRALDEFETSFGAIVFDRQQFVFQSARRGKRLRIAAECGGRLFALHFVAVHLPPLASKGSRCRGGLAGGRETRDNGRDIALGKNSHFRQPSHYLVAVLLAVVNKGD